MQQGPTFIFARGLRYSRGSRQMLVAQVHPPFRDLLFVGVGRKTDSMPGGDRGGLGVAGEVGKLFDFRRQHGGLNHHLLALGGGGPAAGEDARAVAGVGAADMSPEHFALTDPLGGEEGGAASVGVLSRRMVRSVTTEIRGRFSANGFSDRLDSGRGIRAEGIGIPSPHRDIVTRARDLAGVFNASPWI